MTRDDRPGSGRLAPLRPEYRWSTPPARAAQETPRPYPPKRSELVEPPAPDYDVYEADEGIERRRSDAERYNQPPDRSRARGRPASAAFERASAAESYDSSDYAYGDYEPTAPAATKIPSVAPPASPPRMHSIAVDDPARLPIQERQQLLMHTIQLYDDKWKLAGIRANQRKNWLQAYLTPRNKRLELKEAISRNQVLIITVDSRGNTEVKEPKKPRIWRRVLNWFFGS